MSGKDHTSLRPPLIQIEPASIEQLDNLTSVHPGDDSSRRMSQNARHWHSGMALFPFLHM